MCVVINNWCFRKGWLGYRLDSTSDQFKYAYYGLEQENEIIEKLGNRIRFISLSGAMKLAGSIFLDR